jgi:hypothetical protein
MAKTRIRGGAGCGILVFNFFRAFTLSMGGRRAINVEAVPSTANSSVQNRRAFFRNAAIFGAGSLLGCASRPARVYGFFSVRTEREKTPRELAELAVFQAFLQFPQTRGAAGFSGK